MIFLFKKNNKQTRSLLFAPFIDFFFSMCNQNLRPFLLLSCNFRLELGAKNQTKKRRRKNGVEKCNSFISRIRPQTTRCRRANENVVERPKKKKVKEMLLMSFGVSIDGDVRKLRLPFRLQNQITYDGKKWTVWDLTAKGSNSTTVKESRKKRVSCIHTSRRATWKELFSVKTPEKKEINK